MYLHSPITLERLYVSCQWKRGELDNQRIRITDPMGKEHRFHARKLSAHRARIIALLRALPPEMMRSHSSTGMPWHSACNIHAEGIRYDDKYAAVLLAIGQAAGYVTMRSVKFEDILETQRFAIIEDYRWKNDWNSIRWYKKRKWKI